ncbi:endonuclease/exonuclease/phosphatase family protein [Leisingera caerulea]|uniref:endonuclease/exonuclease/phosphatase family protein n=1 Tax=Leisingera caerulea TaxID=506591 RepID=UPI0021A3444F|nr:hypothetical protein [Leisingera caerulea]UWQ84383.1 hypothetical protein K3726_04075 [Leisingera caerulea]
MQDLTNALKKEIQAHALSTNAQTILADGASVIVAGDFNIQAPGQGLRSGKDEGVDCKPAAGCSGVGGDEAVDGYDDSIHILMGTDATARLLSEGLEDTYIAKRFGDGAIDHIFVAGPISDTFENAYTPEAQGVSYAGSDHLPVVARQASSSLISRAAERGEIKRLTEEVRRRLDEIDALMLQLE